jgi:hypothetical protein
MFLPHISHFIVHSNPQQDMNTEISAFNNNRGDHSGRAVHGTKYLSPPKHGGTR